jgi:hypothetical protein
MPDPTINRVHFAYPFATCSLRRCPRLHGWMVLCPECGWQRWYKRKAKAKAALDKHGEKGCGGS